MPRIRFTTDPKLPRDLAHLGYRKDTEVELSSDQAERWLRRGVAVILPDAPGADVLVTDAPLAGTGEAIQLGPEGQEPVRSADGEPQAAEAADEAADPAKPARSRSPRGK